MKTQITPSERLQLIGLLALAGRHSRAMDDIHEAAGALVGINRDSDDFTGHLSDAMFDDNCRDADALLRRLKIVVADAAKQAGSDE